MAVVLQSIETQIETNLEAQPSPHNPRIHHLPTPIPIPPPPPAPPHPSQLQIPEPEAR